MRSVRVGLMLMPAEDFREAALPLFEEGIVGALAWSFDLGWGRPPPDWAEALLGAYSDAGRLYGHGVELSILSAAWEPRQERWIRRFEEEVRARRFVHVTEHYGWMTAGRFTNGTPLPHPYCESAVRIGRARIEVLRAIAGVPVGIENLAFAFGARDVEDQPRFVEELLAPSDGFLLLDVHNLDCQAANYGIDPIALLERYPLERVREIHVAGGRSSRPASDPEGRPFRRDGHDDHVPESCFPLVAHALARCPRLEAIVLEHTDHALGSDAAIARYRADFRRLRALVDASGRAEREDDPTPEPAPQTRAPSVGEIPSATIGSPAPVPPVRAPGALPSGPSGASTLAGIADDPELARFQASLLEVLADAADPAEAIASLRAIPEAAPHRAWIASLEPRGVEVGMELVRQWGARAWTAPPGSMRAHVLDAPHAPIRERALPIPAPGPGQVRIRIRACGVCGTDVHLWHGRFRAPLPIVPGHEPVGTIDALGEGVSGIAIGARVGVPWMQAGCGACAQCARGRAKYCRKQRTWMANGGGLAEHMIAEAAGCVPLPDALPDELAAPLFCAGFTVMSGYRRARPQPGERIAVLGLGGLGHLAIQIARAHGHEVLAITRSRDKARDALALGAHEVLVAQGDVGRELRGAGGADVVISTTSDPAEAGAAVRGLREEGRLVALGLGEGAMPIDPMALLERQASVIGAMQDERADLADLLALAARGAVRPWIEPYGSGQAQRALTRLAEGRVRYRAVLSWR